MNNINDANELMNRFEKFLNEMDRIGVGSRYGDLTGVGTEYVVVNGVVVAKFMDGTLVTGMVPPGNSDVTAA